MRYGDTGDAPPNPGAGGSRLTRVLGQATVDGATGMKARLEKLAAEILGWPGDQTSLQEDRFALAGGTVPPVAFDDVVERMLQAGGAEAVAPAVANAIADAVGARVRTVPFTAERVLEALQGHQTKDVLTGSDLRRAMSG